AKSAAFRLTETRERQQHDNVARVFVMRKTLKLFVPRELFQHRFTIADAVDTRSNFLRSPRHLHVDAGIYSVQIAFLLRPLEDTRKEVLYVTQREMPDTSDTAQQPL